MKTRNHILEVNNVLSSISKAIGAERSTFFLIDKAKELLQSIVAQGLKDVVITLPLYQGIAGSVVKEQKTIIVNDISNCAKFNASLDSQLNYKTKSVIAVPVYNETAEIIGVLQSLNKVDGNFDSKDATILQGFADSIALIVKNKELYFVSEHLKDNFSTLLDVFTTISSELDLDKLIQLIMNKASQITKADRGSLFLVDEATGELWTVYAQGLEKHIVRTKKGIVTDVAKSGSPSIVNNPYEHPKFDAAVDLKTGYTTHSLLSVPVFNSENKVLGVVQVVNKEDGVFDTTDLTILKGFASQISIAIENAQLFEQIMSMKNYLNTLVQNLDNGIVTIDKRMQIKTVNQTFYKMFDLDVKKDLSNTALQDLDQQFKQLFKLCKKTLSSGERQYQDEIELTTDAKKKIVFNLSVLPMQDANGNVVGAINVFQDISREKRIRANLSRYIPRHLINEVINQDALSMLKGKFGKSSILFSDIRNFTTLTEQFGAIQIVNLLNRYFEAMVGSVYKYNGILDKFIGDAIMAVFGVPYANKSDAYNAVSCALDMFKALEKLNSLDIALPKLNIGIGISTGNVVSGNIGSEKRFEYTVIGDSVNLAARLESATKNYGVAILICETTYHEVKEDFNCRKIDTIMVKGKKEPVKIFTVDSRKKPEKGTATVSDAKVLITG